MSEAIQIQQWDDVATVFAEGDHDPVAFLEAVRSEIGEPEFSDFEWTTEDVERSNVYKLTTPPDGYYSFYVLGVGAEEDGPGEWVPATFIRA